jgi:hypothetical protein
MSVLRNLPPRLIVVVALLGVVSSATLAVAVAAPLRFDRGVHAIRSFAADGCRSSASCVSWKETGCARQSERAIVCRLAFELSSRPSSSSCRFPLAAYAGRRRVQVSIESERRCIQKIWPFATPPAIVVPPSANPAGRGRPPKILDAVRSGRRRDPERRLQLHVDGLLPGPAEQFDFFDEPVAARGEIRR